MASIVISVAAGETKKFFTPTDMYGNNITPLQITMIPGASGTLIAQFRTAYSGTLQAVNDGNLSGTIAASATDVHIGKSTEWQFTAATSNGTVEISW